MDNDAHGHLNDFVCDSLFDTAANAYLIGAGAPDVQHGAVIGLVVCAACGHFVHVCVDRRTRRPVSLPAALQCAAQALQLPA